MIEIPLNRKINSIFFFPSASRALHLSFSLFLPPSLLLLCFPSFPLDFIVYFTAES